MRGRKVTVTLVAPGERVRDDEGRWRELGRPIQVDAVVAAAAGSYSSRSAPDRSADAGIILLPRKTPEGVAVTVDTEQVVNLSGAESLPDGEYRVEHVTRTRKHYRCMMQRHRPKAT